MIFYFTGTGNSAWVAKRLSTILNEPCISVTECTGSPYVYNISDQERILLVTPVHSWGPAVRMVQFIRNLKINGYNNQPVYLICCCGDDCGYTNRIVEAELKKKDIPLNGYFSIQMPNNYLLLPGFDVDSKTVERSKLDNADRRIQKIAEAITNHHTTALYTQGSLPYLKSRLVYPIFARYFRKRISFYATEACTKCGLCVRTCPSGCITLTGEEGAPVWNKKGECTQCLACLHLCPQRAIEYGNITKRKGRYHHPDYFKK